MCETQVNVLGELVGDFMYKLFFVGVMVLLVSFFLPVERSTQRHTVLFLCGIPVLAGLLKNRGFRKFSVDRLFYAVLVFVVYFSISLFWSSDMDGVRSLAKRVPVIAGTIIVMVCGGKLAVGNHVRWRSWCFALLPLICFVWLVLSSFEFYKLMPVPVARLGHMFPEYTHPVNSSWIYGGVALVCSGNYLWGTHRQWGRISLGLYPFFCFAMLMTHSRSTVLAFVALLVFLGAFVCIKKMQRLRFLIFLATSLAVFSIYLLSICGLSEGEKVLQVDQAKQLSAELGIQKGLSARPDGVLCSSKNGNARILIWKDLLAQLHGTRWIVGMGLNGAANEHEPILKHPHSGYVWALYHGGIMGLLLLIWVIVEALLKMFRLGGVDCIAGMLFVFGLLILSMDGKTLFSKPRYEWLLFWIPISLIMSSFPRRSANSVSEDDDLV